MICYYQNISDIRNVIQGRTTEIATLHENTQAVNLQLLDAFHPCPALSNSIVDFTCLLFKLEQATEIQYRTQKQVVEHSGVSNKVGALSEGDNSRQSRGERNRYGLATQAEKRTRMLRKMNGSISTGLKKVLVNPHPLQGYKPTYA